jgi:hypothetical protein
MEVGHVTWMKYDIKQLNTGNILQLGGRFKYEYNIKMDQRKIDCEN